MDPRDGRDVFKPTATTAERAGEEVKRTRLAPAPQPPAPKRPNERGDSNGGLTFQVVLPAAQAREVAEQIESVCRRDGLGLALDRRASGAYGSLSVNVTGPPERVNALRSSLAKVIGR